MLCTALDRNCRSVKDFLNFFEILKPAHVEFVCLKQNYDTTSCPWSSLITVVMALAEFEREQTSEANQGCYPGPGRAGTLEWRPSPGI